MYALRTIRRFISRDRLLALTALGFLACQIAGVVHAADLDAHAHGTSCHLCEAHDRSGTAPPIFVTTDLVENADQHLAIEHLISVDETSLPLPPARGPPSLTTR